MTFAAATTESLIRWQYLWYALAAMAMMIAAIAIGNLWLLNFIHVLSSLLWTGVDLFMGFVLGPILRRVDFPVRREIVRRLTPRTLFLMPAVSIISGTTVQNPFAEIDTKSSGGTDSYNSLQFTLTRRLSNGLTLNSQYTLARSFGITSGSNESRTAAEPTGASPKPGSLDTNNYAADRGYNTFDVRNTFNFSAVYDVPFGAGRKHSLGNIGNAMVQLGEG